MVTRVVMSLTKESENLGINSVAVSIIKLETNTSQANARMNIKESLLKISTKTVGHNFLAIVSLTTMEILMDVAKSENLVNIKNQWLYVVSNTDAKTSNTSNVQPLLKEGDNVAFIYNSTTTSTKCKDGLVCHVEEILEAFAKALDVAVVGEFELASQVSDEEWEAIRPSKQERRSSLLQHVKAHLLQNGACSNCTSWHLQSGETWAREYHVKQGDSSSGTGEYNPSGKRSRQQGPQIIEVGWWRPGAGPTLNDELFPHIAHGFRGRTLPLVSFHNPPWQIIKIGSNGSTIYAGLVFDVISEMAHNLNFSFTVEVINTGFGSRNASGNASYNVLEMADLVTNFIPQRIIDLVRSKSVFMGACGFTITDESKEIVNFTNPISTQTYTFLVARPRELSRALLFMSPFTHDTWLCLALTIVAMGPILYMVHKLSPVLEYRGITIKGSFNSIQNCIWYMYGAILQQGGMSLPFADSARIIIGAWWLVVLVISTTYCGNLVAFLTFPKIDIPITTMDELIHHRDTVSWSFVKGSYLDSQLKKSVEPKYKTIYKGGTSMDIQNNNMLPLIEEGKHVFIDWKIRLQYVMRKQFLVTDRCDLALGSDEIFDEKIAFIVAQDTPYLEIINEEIKRLHQVGLIDKWLKDYLPKKDRCFKVKHITVNNHTVNMDDMQGSFFVLFIGFFLALILILIEKIWRRYSLRKRIMSSVQPYTK